MVAATIEERLEAVESELARLKAQFAPRPPSVIGRTAPDFLDRIYGAYADNEAFEEAVRYGREWRESFRRGDMEGDNSEGENGNAAVPA